MTDRPEDRSEARRRTGPLGDEEETRVDEREPGRAEQAEQESRASDDEATRQVPTESAERREDDAASAPEDESAAEDTGPLSRRERRQARKGEEEDKETRVIRTPGSGTTRTQEGAAYPRGYFEAAEEREDRLRDMYGGVDWLASFLGFVFAVVAASFLSAIAGLILIPLGLSLDLSSGSLGPAAITGLVITGILVFLMFFFGGYVAGRLARFDGGRNGMMTVVWTIAAMVAVVAVSGFLPGGVFDSFRNFMETSVLPLLGDLSNLGIAGIVIIVAIILIAVLGGLFGGRVGSRYHSEIDRTT